MSFSEEVSAAVASLRSTEAVPVVDALADPGGAVAALAQEAVVLHVAPELDAEGATHGPRPAEPLWLSLKRGSAAFEALPLRGGEKATYRAARVELVESEESCCDAPACTLQRRHGSAFLVIEGKVKLRFLVAEQRASERAPLTVVRAVADRLAGFLGVPVTPAETEGAGEGEALPAAITPAPGAVEIARFALRSEGERFVLRDHGSAGPRETAGRNAVIGALLMLVAALAGMEGVMAYRAGNTSMAIGAGAGFALLFLAGYAFLGVARFSARYGASSAPLCFVGRDRLVILPWVSREGAVDLRPEGRLGAAIPLGEVRSPSVKSRGDLFAVELDTDHGAMDAMLTEHEGAARYWAAALARRTDEARHPSAGASARQRARQRAREESEQAKA
jgi:hypothetical protein